MQLKTVPSFFVHSLYTYAAKTAWHCRTDLNRCSLCLRCVLIKLRIKSCALNIMICE